MFEYKRISIPNTIKIRIDTHGFDMNINDVFVKNIIDENKLIGWEFNQIYTVSMKPYKRFIDSLLRRKLKKIDQYIMVFRRGI